MKLQVEGWRSEGWLAIVLLLAAVYLYFPNTFVSFLSPNEVSRIYLTEAIVERGSLRIDAAVARRGGELADLARFDGHYYTDKAIGLSLAAVPTYWAFWNLSGRQLGSRRLIPVCRKIAVTLPALAFLAWLLRRWRRHGRLGLTLVVGMALGSSFFPFSLAFIAHVPLAILLFWIHRRVTGESAAAAGWQHHAATGLLCGAAILLDYTGGLFVVFAGLYQLHRSRSLLPPIWMAAGTLLVVSVMFAYNSACFGHPLDLAYNHMALADQQHRAQGFFGISLPRPEAIWGLTFGPLRGLFAHSPYLLLLLPAAVALGRPWRWPGPDLLAGSAVLGYFWLNASLVDWQGGWSLGPRYLIPIYPFALLLILRGAERLEEPTRRRWQLFAAAAVTWACLLHLASVGTWMHPPLEGLRFPAVEISTHLLSLGLTAENAGLSLGLSGLAGLVPALLFSLAALALAGAPWRRRAALAVLAGAALYTVAALGLHRTLTPEQVEQVETFARVVARASQEVPQ